MGPGSESVARLTAQARPSSRRIVTRIMQPRRCLGLRSVITGGPELSLGHDSRVTGRRDRSQVSACQCRRTGTQLGSRVTGLQVSDWHCQAAAPTPCQVYSDYSMPVIYRSQLPPAHRGPDSLRPPESESGPPAAAILTRGWREQPASGPGLWALPQHGPARSRSQPGPGPGGLAGLGSLTDSDSQ